MASQHTADITEHLSSETTKSSAIACHMPTKSASWEFKTQNDHDIGFPGVLPVHPSNTVNQWISYTTIVWRTCAELNSCNWWQSENLHIASHSDRVKSVLITISVKHPSISYSVRLTEMKW